MYRISLRYVILRIKKGRIGFMMRVEKLTKGSESIEKFKSMVNIPVSVLRGKSKKEKIELFQGVMYESFLHFISCHNKCSIDCKIDVSWDDDYEWSLRKIRVDTGFSGFVEMAALSKSRKKALKLLFALKPSMKKVFCIDEIKASADFIPFTDKDMGWFEYVISYVEEYALSEVFLSEDGIIYF